MQLPDVLLSINKGATVAELCEKFRGLVQAVRGTSKARILAAVDQVNTLIKSGTKIEPLVGSVTFGAATSQSGGQR